ncbi:1-deoxy-D-xylulose-5-phosphate synthase [Desulfotomaculum copahuensis]|uniref:1-deoxy-D-xylulose-5-phosphate synthase n=1 Tax=Desulfotomaculum copahuensis TaxID=1838280 RepID=A0A1B7LIX1_9FIRM|nr:1-deoxy-D-xylulose-5-phosphate synthase [Desulfotomaculum copahuensis]OAT86517.1 1-deoxy-D-xylulose-5-phosphate synthase [Desulfotomaculum copahuensis]
MSRLLPEINGPADLKDLDAAGLQQLAREIREELINTVAANGGHLAPNLGVVELTLALHRVFQTPRDKIIWDVGHQCYVHKLLTGRRPLFHTLRQSGGLSGFPRRQESAHDAFGTGHSSTSISAALGMALARDLKGGDHAVVAVIGDGAMTGGMAFEAMNHAGHLQKNLIVVLNDNEMSIAPNVGGLAEYLGRLRTDPMYSRGKEEIEQLLRRIPAIGPRVVKVVERLKDSLKYLVVPGMFFEELGFIYLGPIDGHNIQALINVFQQAAATRGPVLVHVRTRKGYGYAPAEANSGVFHGVGPFDVQTGRVIKKDGPPSYTEVFGRTLVELGQSEPEIVAITAAMPAGTGLDHFARAFPERFFDTGIAEQHAVTLGAGLAAEGLKPVVAVYSTFLQRAYDQVLHDVCLQQLPLTLAVDRGGLVGDDGATHHGVFDFAFLRSIPHMVIMAPKDENELRHMLKTALEYPGPAALRYPRGAGTGCPLTGKPAVLPFGRAEVLREGNDITLLAAGSMVSAAVKAAAVLEGLGISAAVINARFVKPLDDETITRYAMRTRRLVTMEEHVLAGGFGSAVLELLGDRGLRNIRVVRMGIPDEFIEHGTRDRLLARCGLTADAAVQNALLMLNAARRTGKKAGAGLPAGGVAGDGRR